MQNQEKLSQEKMVADEKQKPIVAAMEHGQKRMGKAISDLSSTQKYNKAQN
jgi:hypothetical protein